MAADLVAPRLQLRWAAGDEPGLWLCHYEMVLPLREHDIRLEYDENDIRSEIVVPMYGPTKRTSSGVEPPCTAPSGDRLSDPPYRDSAHARWDAEALGGIPIYVIAPDGMAFEHPAKAPAGHPMSAPKFKVGDRVRVIAVDSISDCDVGQTGTVRNLDDCPWVHFDTPTRFECEVKPFGIPAFFADIPNEDHLELIDSNEGATP